MKHVRLVAALALAVTMAGCASVETPSRNSPFEQSSQVLSGGEMAAFATPPSSLSVTEVEVLVPERLVVSEENSYYPRGDIVWRGDPPGDRHAQIKAIFDAAIATGTEGMAGDVPVKLEITVERFHSMSEKTRYSFGGVHSIRFVLAVRDAETDLLLGEPREIKANLRGFGGQRAINAELQGLTQKVRVSEHLSGVIATELSTFDQMPDMQFGVMKDLDTQI